jgi:hypothetical protein
VRNGIKDVQTPCWKKSSKDSRTDSDDRLIRNRKCRSERVGKASTITGRARSCGPTRLLFSLRKKGSSGRNVTSWPAATHRIPSTELDQSSRRTGHSYLVTLAEMAAAIADAAKGAAD